MLRSDSAQWLGITRENRYIQQSECGIENAVHEGGRFPPGKARLIQSGGNPNPILWPIEEFPPALQETLSARRDAPIEIPALRGQCNVLERPEWLVRELEFPHVASSQRVLQSQAVAAHPIRE